MSFHWTENKYTGVVTSWDFFRLQADFMWIFTVFILRGTTSYIKLKSFADEILRISEI